MYISTLVWYSSRKLEIKDFTHLKLLRKLTQKLIYDYGQWYFALVELIGEQRIYKDFVDIWSNDESHFVVNSFVKVFSFGLWNSAQVIKDISLDHIFIDDIYLYLSINNGVIERKILRALIARDAEIIWPQWFAYVCGITLKIGFIQTIHKSFQSLNRNLKGPSISLGLNYVKI